MTEAAKKNITIKIDKERCKGCVLCVDVCPQKILEMSEDINTKGMQYAVVKKPEKCTGCGMCYIMCPDCCIEIKIVNREL